MLLAQYLGITNKAGGNYSDTKGDLARLKTGLLKDERLAAEDKLQRREQGMALLASGRQIANDRRNCDDEHLLVEPKRAPAEMTVAPSKPLR
jgi:hypothetical protein